ncbi:hypothetical protein SH2C18_14970 [Clostridium sediminicola]|uniref:hypothetical protein n=1 Tax=Clostridium sediminicola TaxID=3114879 RepID=UPI0031F22658
MKKQLLIIGILICLVLFSCYGMNQKYVSNLNKQILQLKQEKIELNNRLKEIERENLDSSISEEINYLDTLIEGKETFTSYENIIKNFGQPKKVKNIINKNGVYIHGHFAILIYDGIEFVLGCSGDSDNPFSINEKDEVFRVDITTNNYKLNRNFLNNLKVGDSPEKIAKYYNKKITEINYDSHSHMEVVVKSLRNDIETYQYQKGIYFEGENDNGLCLGIVLLIDDDKIARIVLGLPTAG